MESHLQPSWIWKITGSGSDEKEFVLRHPDWTIDRGIPRSGTSQSLSQQQTLETFGFKWAKRETFEHLSQTFTPMWLQEKYGKFSDLTFLESIEGVPLVLDAGCGAGLSGLAFFGQRLSKIKYLGVDISDAVHVAGRRASENGLTVGLLQCDLAEIPLVAGSVDVVFCEGVLHHTDDPMASLANLVTLLKPGGYAMFYVYKKKGPIREFTDDLLRRKLSNYSFDDAWNALMPLTKLGMALGELDLEIEVPERIELLDIPAGKINIQRLFYWHVIKAFYRPEISLEEMNHINFDWFVPANADRFTPDEVRDWCFTLNLEVLHENIEDAGITIVARKAQVN